MSGPVALLPVHGLPEIQPGDDLARLLRAYADLRDGDVVVVSQKIVSKAEGAFADPLAGESPAVARRRLAREQATDVVADTPGVLIVRTRHGLVCANAGIDASNVPAGRLTLLPVDPDASARALRVALQAAGVAVAVVVADTFGRAWREGQTDVAIGVAGLQPVRDERGRHDRQGQILDVTQTAVADELAAAADLVRTKASGVPVVVVRGFDPGPSTTGAATDLVRDVRHDLFRRGRGMLAAALRAPWPAQWAAGVGEDDLAHVRTLVPDAQRVSQGPPDAIRAGDDFATALVAAALADLGLVVRWDGEPGDRVVTAGRPAGAG